MHLIHRGIVSKKYHENLLKSFEQSFKKGFGIETDIHATKDNEFICFHDFLMIFHDCFMIVSRFVHDLFKICS